ncbi:MAG: hypothetical protein KDK78_08465 [Chlamydiia bacterium]|nr:hypothetical protein [Chlamydiia bacterium]
MKTQHLANTEFEFELAGMRAPELTAQLEFLPLLYASANDVVLVHSLPKPEYIDALQQHPLMRDQRLPELRLIEDYDPSLPLECWGWAPSLRRFIHEMPSAEAVALANSKAFSFAQCPSLPKATLLKTESDLRQWLLSFEGPKILKSCFGVAGGGRKRIDGSDASKAVLRFCEAEWKAQRPVLAEPWVERILDFSSQWMLYPDGSHAFYCLSMMDNSASGVYQGTTIGPKDWAKTQIGPYADRHLELCQDTLKALHQAGYWGPLGVDAMLYNWDGALALHPIVEINARGTMSWATWKLQQRWAPDGLLQLGYIKAEEAAFEWLPSSIEGRVFPRQLRIELR